jgi:hypothetical protein
MAAAEAIARGALSRSRVVARGLVHAAQVVGLAVCLRAFAEFPWTAAAAPPILRAAASFLVPPRLYFLAANVIVVALATLFRRDAASSSPPGSSGGDAQHPFLAFLGPALPPITEAEEPSGQEAPPEVVFEDKEAVHVRTLRAQPPRRSMSEKTGGGGGGGAAGSAASPELRRAKSENGRRRQRRSSSSAAAAAVAELGVDDGEAFRLAVEAFIAKQQTWFHREESLVARADAGGEDGPAIAGAAVAVQ